MSNTVSSILSGLATLRTKDLARVVSAAQGLYERESITPASSPPAGTQDAKIAFTAITTVLAQARLKTLPWAVFIRQNFYNKFEADAEQLLAVVRDELDAKTSVQEVTRATFLVKLLANRLSHAMCPISTRTLAINLSKVYDAIDSAFPGYRQNGMLKLVVGKRVDGYLPLRK